MNTRTRNVLAACLTVSILAGFLPYSTMQTEGAKGDKIKTVHDLNGFENCENTEPRFQNSKLSFSAQDEVGMIKVQTGSKVYVGIVNDISVIGNGFSLSGSITGLCGRGQVFELNGPCSNFESDRILLVSNFVFDPDNLPDDTGLFDVNKGDLECTRGVQAPSNSGCIIGTDKGENLIDKFNQNCIDAKGGNDKIAGLAGNDKLNGGDGKDLLAGANGNDELTGGQGADLFQCGGGNDKITDFKTSEGDKKTNDCEQF